MRTFGKTLLGGIRALGVSPAVLVFCIVQSLLIGYAFYDRLDTYAFLSLPLDTGIVPVPGLEPLRDLFVPVFRVSYLFDFILLPILFTGIAGKLRSNGSYNFINQFFQVGRVIAAQFLVCLTLLGVLLALSLPAVYYWHMVGGSIFTRELALLYGGYSAYGILAAAVTLFTSSLVKNRPAAVLLAIMVLGSFVAVEFSGMIPALSFAGTVRSLPEMMEPFEQGRFSIPALLSMILPALFFLFLSNILLLVRGMKKSVLIAVASLLFLAAIVGAVIAVNAGAIPGDLDCADHKNFPAHECLTLEAERQISTAYNPFAQSADAIPVLPEHRGHPLAVSKKDRDDILVLYWAVIPLGLVFFLLVRLIEKSRINSTYKRMIVAPATWLVILLCLALMQGYYFKSQNRRIFPSVRELLPRWAGVVESAIIHDSPLTKKSPEQGGTTPVLKGDPNCIYAGENYRHLQRFYKKLSDLQAHRRNSVHIMHYGDSLIWGDCFSKTMKHRFQKEFGDGGRGIVPPVETMATALKDHVNKTPPGGFTQYAIRHEFRYLGKFYIKPDVNPRIGFTGEGAYARSPLSEIRMEAPAGSAPWKKVRVMVRNPGITASECRVNLDSGGGTESRLVKLGPGGTGIASWELPGADRVTINFIGTTGALPAVDAVDVETGSGVVYSTVVRMGIHMAWMNAIPDQNLVLLRHVNPDLLIFQFGINEAASLGAFPEFTGDELRSQMRQWLTKLRALLPETDILLVGPPERLQTYQGVLAPMKETLTVRQVQREEAERAGIAFFDTYECLGGEGQMLTMANSGLAMKDYTHFTMRGGDMAAEGLYTSLMNVFRKKSERPKIDFHAEEKTAILFNSASFAYFMAAVVMMGLILMRWPVLRFGFLAIASYYFYATWNLWPLACLAATTVTDYSMGRFIQRARERGGRGSVFLAVSLAVNLGILFTLKYFDFFSDLAGKALNAMGWQVSVPILNILLPVGISFYTFQSLSYTIDVWRGNLVPEKNLIKYAHYVSLFTQLLAGPIVKAREFLPGLRDRVSHFLVQREHVSAALFLILSGLVKKAGADWLAGTIVDRVYASPHMFMSLETLTAVYAYGLQIYGDFSGYSDMAIGCAMLLGYNIPVNFRRPYASASVSEFWQRWHITLGSWLRDYLYISLGGNRKRVLLNLGITMFLCGLWHGAAIPFVIWGLYHGMFMIVERVTGLNKKKTANPFLRGLRIVVTLHAVLFGWIIFRSDSWETFTGILRSLVRFSAGAPNVGVTLIAVMVIFYVLHYTPVAWKERLQKTWAALPATVQGVAASCITLVLFNIAAAEVKPFIYFQF